MFSRRQLLTSSVPAFLLGTQPTRLRADELSDRLLHPVHDAVVCPWSPQHPRHDHQLIFPLDDRRLLLVLWNNVASESNWPRIPLTAAISKDDGRSWTHFHDIDNRLNHDAAYPSATFVGNEVLVAYYSRSTRWKRDSEVTLRIYTVSQFYG